jgi:hypothetical protein
MSREPTEFELDRKAERYSRMHGEDDETERRPGLLARLLNGLRRRADTSA